MPMALKWRDRKPLPESDRLSRFAGIIDLFAFFSKNPTELRKSLRILRGWSSHFRPEEGLVVRTARLLSMPRFMDCCRFG